MQKKLTILLVAPQPFMQDRGTPIAVRLLAESLSSLGHHVHLLVYHEGYDIQIEGVIIHRIAPLKWIKNVSPGMSWKKIVCDIFVFIKMFRLRKKIQFDLIHAVEEAVFLARIFKLCYGIPYVYDMDSSMSNQIIDQIPFVTPLKGLLEGVEKKAMKDSLGVLAVCSALEDIVKEMAPGTKVARLEDISLLNGSVKGNEDLKKSCSVSGVCLLYVGNLAKYQGIDLLLDSFAVALEKEIAADLIIIGGMQQDIEKYESITVKLGIEQYVHFVGPRQIDLLGYYLKQADILVSPRIQGSNTPMKIYSYLGSGKTILATKLSTHTQILDETVSCLVAPERKAMANGMVRLIDNRDLREQLGKAGKKLAEQEYSASAFQRKLGDFYLYISEQLN